jgi:hypothetical protein
MLHYEIIYIQLVMTAIVQRRMYKTLLLLSSRKNVQVEPDFGLCNHCHRAFLWYGQ